MKVYVASQHNNREATRRAQARFISDNHSISHDWTACEISQYPERERAAALTAFALADLQGVRDCDALVLLAHRGMSATLSEFGMALALDKLVIVVDGGGDGCPFNIFYHLPQVRHVFTVEDAADELRRHEAPCAPSATCVTVDLTPALGSITP